MQDCHEHYIGQTGQSLRQRMTVHRQQIRDPDTRKIPISQHIEECGGRSLPKFSVFPFDRSELLNKEGLIKKHLFIKFNSLHI